MQAIANLNPASVADTLLSLSAAFVLGALIGLERQYRQRTAGLRTNVLVALGAAIFVDMANRLGGHEGALHVVAYVVSGVGFLGAGVIMRDGMTISGLTTAASIWATGAIGVLVGVGFYPAAILLTLLSAGLMMWGAKVEAWLPSRRAIALTLNFSAGFEPSEEAVRAALASWDYAIAEGSLHIASHDGQLSWQFVMIARRSGPRVASLFELSRQLRALDGVAGVQLAHARN